MRKLPISLVISFLLLFAQHGALIHELGHIVQAGKVDVRVQADSQLDKTCELCLAFSQVTSPASHSVDLPSFAPGGCAATPAEACAATPADVPTPRSRGPPALELNI